MLRSAARLFHLEGIDAKRWRNANTVLRELKKKAPVLESVNTALLRTLNPAEVAWNLERAGEAEAEMDEMWSFVGNKGNPRWLWHAIGAP